MHWNNDLSENVGGGGAVDGRDRVKLIHLFPLFGSSDPRPRVGGEVTKKRCMTFYPTYHIG